jgi:hypothetical protein
MASPDKPEYRWSAHVRWRWRRWRARTLTHQAYMAYVRWPSTENAWRRDIAEEYLRRVEASRP